MGMGTCARISFDVPFLKGHGDTFLAKVGRLSVLSWDPTGWGGVGGGGGEDPVWDFCL